MSNQLLKTLAADQSLDAESYWKIVCNTVIPGNQSTEAVTAFLAVAQQYGLNPLTKEIYAFPSRGGISPIVSVDGWLKLANVHPKFDGLETEEIREGGNVLAVKCTIHRKDRGHPTVATEYMSECKGNTEPWNKWPVRMLTNKAMIQAIRRAFSFAGIYDPDEGERIAEAAEAEYHNVQDVSSTAKTATDTKAAELTAKLAAEREQAEGESQATQSAEADSGTSSGPEEVSAQQTPDEPDDFDVMDWDALKNYATWAKDQMSAGHKKTAKAAIEAEDRDTLIKLFRSLAVKS